MTEQKRKGRPPSPRIARAGVFHSIGVIPLTLGKVAIVDASDFEWLNQWVWSAMLAKSGWYAVRLASGDSKHTRMHRLIAGNPAEIVDHWDGNGLNNRRGNLRPCSNAQNMRNGRVLRRSNKSGFRGVQAYGDRWIARITLDYVTKHIGVFDSAELAARAYDEEAVALFGDFARVNGVK